MSDTQMEIGGPGTAVQERESTALSSPTVESMMQMAVQQGPEGVEALERLVALKERMEDRAARQAFFDALSELQKEVQEIPKTRTAEILTKSGGKYSYRYSPLDAITRAIREPLKRQGFSYSWDTESSDKPNELVVVFVLRHIDGHEERSRFPVPTDTAASMSGAQKNGAALTYGRRQSLIAGLGLTSTDDDNDAPDLPGEPISKEQLLNLQKLINEAKPNVDRMLKHFGVESLDKLTTDRYFEAIGVIEEARRRASK